MKIKISVSAYNEIATALERLGIKADGTQELTLEKGTQLSCPIDFKMVTIRRDVATIAAPAYKEQQINGSINFVDFCKEVYDWVISEDKAENKSKGWK